MTHTLLAQVDPNDVFGQIEAPDVIQSGYGTIDGSGGGIVPFISNILVLLTVIGGVVFLINLLMAGFALVASDGDSKKLDEVKNKFQTGFIGLLLMVGAPLIAALLGLFFTGSATTFLNPTIFGPGSF